MKKFDLILIRVSMIIVLICMLTAMLALLLAVNQAYGQTVNLTTTRASITTATIDMAYNGPQTSLGCLSVRIQYDTSLFLCTSITQSGIIENKGNFFPNVTDDKICVSWWVTNFTDTLWSDARPIVKLNLKVKDGCGLFHFIDFEAEWNQLGDIDADVIPATFMDTVVCYDSGRRAVMPEFGLNVGRARFTVKDRRLR